MKLLIGTHTKSQIKKELKEFKVSTWAEQILDKVTFSKNKQELELEILSVKDLGFDLATTQEFYTKAKERGLELCPAEVGPYLRLRYTDQPKGEWLVIGMEPIAGSSGDLRLFDVVHDDSDCWLRAYYGNPGDVWDGSLRFVFLRRIGSSTLDSSALLEPLNLESVPTKDLLIEIGKRIDG